MGKKPNVAILVAIAAASYRYYKGDVKSYRDNLLTWSEPKVQFQTPQPIDQSMLYRSVEQVLEPTEVKDEDSEIAMFQ